MMMLQSLLYGISTVLRNEESRRVEWRSSNSIGKGYTTTITTTTTTTTTTITTTTTTTTSATLEYCSASNFFFYRQFSLFYPFCMLSLLSIIRNELLSW